MAQRSDETCRQQLTSEEQQLADDVIASQPTSTVVDDTEDAVTPDRTATIQGTARPKFISKFSSEYQFNVFW